MVWLSSHKFIYLDKLNLQKEDSDRLKKIIDNKIIEMGEGYVSSRKIYQLLFREHKELLKSLKVITDSFSAYSLIRVLFKNDYGFRRPLIALDKTESIDSGTVIADYISKLDIFNSNTIKHYVKLHNIRGLYSYLNFMEDMSDNFVQVNIDTMVKKENFNIDKDSIDAIDNLLEVIINSYGEMRTKDFKGFNMFPSLKYKWNKYLLIGTIRTYLSDKYTIINTTNFYDTTDFILTIES